MLFCLFDTYQNLINRQIKAIEIIEYAHDQKTLYVHECIREEIVVYTDIIIHNQETIIGTFIEK